MTLVCSYAVVVVAGPIIRIAQPRVIRLRSPQDGIDERRFGEPKIERGQRRAISRLEQRLILRRGEKQFVHAIAVVVERFDSRWRRARCVTIGDRFRANQIAQNVGPQMRSV